MSELRISTGTQGDEWTIHVDWFDENNVPKTTDVVVRVLERDKPRTLSVSVIDPGGPPF